jgi:hypothetical protein
MIAFLLVVQYCILNHNNTLNSTAGNISSVTGLLQYENSSPCLYNSNLLGFAILGILMIVVFGILAIRVDVIVAAAVAAWIGTGIALFLIQLSLLAPNDIGIPLAISIIATIIGLVRGGLSAY